MSRFVTQEVDEVKEIRGVTFPADLRLGKLLVTGPPGSGKTSLIEKIKGWPQEGFVSIATRHWWRDQTLVFRPREIHLALPFKGEKDPFTVFSDEWLEAFDDLVLDLDRIVLPPPKRYFFSTNWYGRYAFEFLIPPPQRVFDSIRARQERGTHHRDSAFRLEHLVAHAETYRAVALHFHRAGFAVHLREDYLGRPRRFNEVE